MSNIADRKTVAHLIYRFDIGGLEKVMADTINHLTEFKHVIIVLTSAVDESKSLLNKDIKIVELNKKDGNDFSVWRKLYTLFREIKPDVLHSYNLPTLEYQILAALCRIPSRIHAEHGRDISDPKGQNKKYRLLRKLVNPFVHHWLAVSKDLADWLTNDVQIPIKKVELIRNGVDTGQFKPTPPANADHRLEGFAGENDIIIGTIGRLDPVKNHPILIKLFKEIAQRDPVFSLRVKIAIVGSGSGLEGLAELIKQHGYDDHFWLPGARYNIAQLLNEFDLFILPSIAEGIPITLLEAMATGLPALATNVGGIPEVITDNRYLVDDPNDVQQFADKILSLLGSPTRALEAGDQSRERIVDQFSLHSMTGQYRRIYQG
jgi:sugar transferase (PEP-CTERM/EpsH1 system associated)